MQSEYRTLLEEFVRLLLEEFGEGRVVSVLVFGSVARGTARPDSDVDVCLVMRDLPLSRYQRHRLLNPVLTRLRQSEPYKELVRRNYGPDISAVIYRPEEVEETKPIFLDMVEEGELLRDNGTFRRKLDSLRSRMRELGSRKVQLADGSYYWILKPGLRFGEVVEL
jgi:predicted nucleotidyltransferase